MEVIHTGGYSVGQGIERGVRLYHVLEDLKSYQRHIYDDIVRGESHMEVGFLILFIFMQ